MYAVRCPHCRGPVKQLTNAETGATKDLDKLVPFYRCSKCNITYEEADLEVY